MHYQEMHANTPFIFQSPFKIVVFPQKRLLVISLQVTYHRGLILIQSPRARNIQHAAGGLRSGSVNAICLFFLIRIRLFRELLHKSATHRKSCSPLPPFSRCSPCSDLVRRSRRRLAGERTYYRGDSGGILFGPWVGIITGVIAGITGI